MIEANIRRTAYIIIADEKNPQPTNSLSTQYLQQEMREQLSKSISETFNKQLQCLIEVVNLKLRKFFS